MNKMTNGRSALSQGPDQLFEIAIASREALVLTKVFCPGDYDECLEINVGLFEIAVQAPP